VGKKSRKKNTRGTVLTSNVAEVEAIPLKGEIKISSLALLAVLVLVCLTPFLGKAFHIDDTLFVWTSQQIAQHPQNPYGFTINWYTAPQPMWEVTQNPPLSSYYMAGIARIWGWSEVALHAGFLVVALAAILGTYALARRLTRWPLLAAAATLAAPGFLVSSTTLMCDTMMVALWIFAILFWLDGVERKQPALLLISALLIAVCALTKYFGIALIPLLLLYSLVRTRRIESSLLYLLLPVAALAGYQSWTGALSTARDS
jgi:4-amino-4-deoxy-L-arabinose transferase-like glycosyltransferase